MSIFSATGFLTPADADAYTNHLFELLGDRDPLHVLAATPAALRQALDRITPARLDAREMPGKWSTRMVLAHLADSELVGAFRLRMIIAHDRPAIASYDQDQWANSLGYENADPTESIERFTALRKSNLKLWDGPPERLARAGVHAERGEESVDRMRRLYAGHDLGHLRQLERIWMTVSTR